MTKKKTVTRKIVIGALTALCVLITLFVSFVAVKIYKYNKTPVDLNVLDVTAPTFLDIDGNSILSSKNLTLDINKISETTKQAFISIEDKNFYSHKGYNSKRIIKAGLDNVTRGKVVSGASTITQQLAKNTFLNNEKTFDRKLKELVIARKIEKNYSKNDILESYLNTIYFGENCYGLEAASEHYFNKPASDLTLNESAFLAGIINSPSYLSQNLEAANKRKNLVLSEMLKDGKIDENEYNECINLNIEPSKNNDNFIAENYCYAATREVASKLKLTEDEIYKSNITIYTNLDLDKQKMLLNAAKQHVNSDYNFSATIIDNETNAVLAFVSSATNVININRSPGSLIKPMLVYAPALEENIINEYTLINNEQTNFNGYSPKNAGNNYSKNISVKNAVAKSVNVPAVKILNYVGVDKAKKTAKNFGLKFSKNDNNLAIALGATENGENFISLVNAYSAFANNGQIRSASFVNKVIDSAKNIINFNNVDKHEAISSDTAYLITDMLKETAKTGTAKKLSVLKGEVASKTGTVGAGNGNLNSDAYNVSFTNSLTIGVHVFDKDELMPASVNGSTIPTEVSLDVLSKLNLNETFDVPDSIEKVNVDIEELNGGHIVLANEFMPERYVKQVYVSKRCKPTIVSNKFLTVDAPELKVNVTENSVVIEFEARDINKTEIYRNGKLIKTVFGKNGKQIVVDDFVPTEKTTYTAKNFVKNNRTGTEIESKLSAPKIVLVKKEKELSKSELDNLDDFSNVFDSDEEDKKPSLIEGIKKFFKV